jgi:hypothetical protein
MAWRDPPLPGALRIALRGISNDLQRLTMKFPAILSCDVYAPTPFVPFACEQIQASI